MIDRTRDLVERLRDADAECRPGAPPIQSLCEQAADEIERLAAELEKAREDELWCANAPDREKVRVALAERDRLAAHVVSAERNWNEERAMRMDAERRLRELRAERDRLAAELEQARALVTDAIVAIEVIYESDRERPIPDLSPSLRAMIRRAVKATRERVAARKSKHEEKPKG